MNVYWKIKHAKFRLKREEYTEKVGQFVIAILLWTILISGSIEQLTSTREILIENAHASMVELPLVKVAAGEVSKPDSSTLREEYREEKSNPSTLEVRNMILKEFGEDGELMVAIAKAESGQDLNTKAYNENRDGSFDSGVFQINSIHGYDREWLEIPENNIKTAKKIKDTQGLTAWVAYNNGNYKYNL